MPRSCQLARIVLPLLVLWTPGVAHSDSGGAPEGRAALEAARAAYRASGPFQETLELTLEMPDGRREPRRQEYGTGRDGGAFFALSSKGRESMRIVARDGRMVATEAHVAGLYAEVPYQGDFAAALDRIGGAQAGLAAPAAVVAAQGGDVEAFLSALRMGVLEPLQIVAARAAQEPSALVEIDLRAANGSATVGLDPATHRLREVRISLGEGAQQVRASGRFRFTAGEAGDSLAWPELAGRTAVRTFAELEGGAYPLGQPAPDVTLASLDGGTVRLADLRGAVIVLDFWATWCVPCWQALEHTSELAAWARDSALPVRVFALNTLETTADPEELRRSVAEFLRSRKLSLPVLLDQGKAAFSSFHSPGLPSVVVIDRTGRLARYHSGRLPDMTATLRAEVQELLSGPGPEGR